VTSNESLTEIFFRLHVSGRRLTSSRRPHRRRSGVSTSV